MYAVFLSFLISWMVWSRIIRWSQVALMSIPPAWASISWPSFVTLSLMILPNTFPRLLASVIPLSFEHFPLVPVLLYGLRIWPTCQLSGNSSFTCILLKASLKISLIFLFASMNVLLGMSSGPRHFSLAVLRFFWASMYSVRAFCFFSVRFSLMVFWHDAFFSFLISLFFYSCVVWFGFICLFLFSSFLLFSSLFQLLFPRSGYSFFLSSSSLVFISLLKFSHPS